MTPVYPRMTRVVVMRGAQLLHVDQSGKVAFPVLASSVVNEPVNEARAVVGTVREHVFERDQTREAQAKRRRGRDVRGRWGRAGRGSR